MRISIPAAGLVAATVAAGAWAQGRLPACPGTFQQARWTNCYGEATTPTGARYAGEWVNDRYEGRGTYTYRDGTKYVGEFRQNRRNGQGTLTYPDGATYTGSYKDDLRSGYGTFIYPDGTKYVGEYRDDRRNGRGAEYRSDGRLQRAGTWVNDVFEAGR